MKSARVYEVAKLLNVDKYEVLKAIEDGERHIEVNNVMGRLTADEVGYVYELFGRTFESKVVKAQKPKLDISTSKVFGELRELFAREPSRGVFKMIWLRVKNNLHQEVIDYAAGCLRRWPSHIVRDVPAKLVDALLRGERGMILSLCNALTIESKGLDDDGARRLVQLNGLDNIQHLYLRDNLLSADGVRVLLLAAPGLVTLDVSLNGLGEEIGELIAGSRLTRLKTLTLDRVGLAPRSILTIFKAESLAQLKVLSAEDNALNLGALLAGIDGTWAPSMSLDVLSLSSRKAQDFEVLSCLQDVSQVHGAVVLPADAQAPDEALDDVLARLDREPTVWSAWSEDYLHEQAQLLVTAYFLTRGSQDAQVVERVREVARALSPVEPVELRGMAISWHPTAQFSQLRFLESKEIPVSSRSYFYALEGEMKGFVGAFVDPMTYTYRTFENILPMDRYFEGADLSVTSSNMSAYADDQLVSFELGFSESGCGALLGLDRLGVYQAPLNAASRGGSRFIFHSASLAEALTECVRGSLSVHMMKGFSHVNPVFRCNRFEPGDEHFHAHMDTPYYDAAQNHISRYTMLIYLTGGEGEHVLSFDDAIGVHFDRLEEMTCVVFDQRLPHEGRAFFEGEKLFLRTELIFEATRGEITHEPSIGQLFSKACYMTGESVVFPELSEYMNDCYNRVASAHWSGELVQQETEPFVHKRYKGVDFVTNGYDFWCDAQQVSLKEAAVLAVLDHFNCQVSGQSFRSLCDAEVTHGSVVDAHRWIGPLLSAQRHDEARPIHQIKKDGLYSEHRAEGGSGCCPFHCGNGEEDDDDFVPANNGDVISAFEDASAFTRRLIGKAPVYLLGEQIFIDPSRVQVRGDKVYMCSAKSLEPVNFAACWNSEPPEAFLEVSVQVDTPFVLVPPMSYREINGCYHLMLDFFRNDWMVDTTSMCVPLPKIGGFEDWQDAMDEFMGEDERYDNGYPF